MRPSAAGKTVSTGARGAKKAGATGPAFEPAPAEFLRAAGFKSQQELEAFERRLLQQISAGEIKVNPRALLPGKPTAHKL